MAATRRGLSYPLTATDSGSLSTSEDNDLVAEQIYSTLETRPSERVMRPGLGTPNYLFNSVANAAFIPGRLQVAIALQVFGINNPVLSGRYEEEGVLDVEMKYDINDAAQPPIQFKLRL